MTITKACADRCGRCWNSSGLQVKDYASAVHYLAEGPSAADCLIVDLRMPGIGGLELQDELNKRGVKTPLILVTGHGDIALAVRAMKAGAFDFLEKPFDDEALLANVRRAIADNRRVRDHEGEKKAAAELIALLTGREKEVFDQLIRGKSNKLIAHELGISPRTVEIHRHNVQEKLKARDLSDLVRAARSSGRLQ